MESIPPTKDALLQHIKRVAYLAGIWTTSELTEQNRPSPESSGWKLDESPYRTWVPLCTTLPIACKACMELIKCGCKSTNGCGARCGCKKEKWDCTDLCSCNCMK